MYEAFNFTLAIAHPAHPFLPVPQPWLAVQSKQGWNYKSSIFWSVTFCWGTGPLPAFNTFSLDFGQCCSEGFKVPPICNFDKNGGVGGHAFSKVEPSLTAAESQGDRKSFKMAIHSTLKSLSSHQRLLKPDRVAVIYSHGDTYIKWVSYVCVCMACMCAWVSMQMWLRFTGLCVSTWRGHWAQKQKNTAFRLNCGAVYLTTLVKCELVNFWRYQLSWHQ